MTDATDTSSQVNAAPPVGVDLLLWDTATSDQQKVMRRIAVQRERLRARSAARAQALALRDAQDAVGVRPDAPLMERLMTFGRLHPIAVAVAGGVAMIVGPRKLIRLGGIVLPWVMRFQQKRRS